MHSSITILKIHLLLIPTRSHSRYFWLAMFHILGSSKIWYCLWAVSSAQTLWEKFGRRRRDLASWTIQNNLPCSSNACYIRGKAVLAHLTAWVLHRRIISYISFRAGTPCFCPPPLVQADSLSLFHLISSPSPSRQGLTPYLFLKEQLLSEDASCLQWNSCWATAADLILSSE